MAGGNVLQSLGYLGVFLAIMLEAIGVPFPSETILVTSGIEMTRGVFSLIPLWFSAVAGNLVGSNIAYFIGRYVGRTVLVRYGRYVRLTEPRIQSVERSFHKYQALFLFVGKFIAFVRIIVPYLAGINKINFIAFTIYNTIAAFMWSYLFITLGHFIEALWATYSHFLIVHWYLSIPALAVIVLLYWWIHKKITPH